MARDKIQEILDKNQRNKKLSSLSSLIEWHIERLQEEFLGEQKHSDEIVKYFPVALVVTIETHIRNTIKDIVDSDSQYSDNISKFDNIKLDMNILKALYRKEVTLGDFISHLLPISNLDSINKTLSTLLDIKFLLELKNHREPDYLDLNGNNGEKTLQNPEKIFLDLKELYKLRNIYAHELAPDCPPDREQLLSISKSAISFIKASVSMVSDILYPNAPISNAAMKEEAGKKLEEQEEKLGHLIENLKNTIEDNDLKDFDKSHKSWLEFREQESNFRANYFAGGGTMWGLVYLTTKDKLTYDRTQSLKDIIEDII
ncbi:DUF1311 domain-containing protein [Bacteriovoracaceae bacterium]|nr:DUF1311 domain-containing protein [Bacteriovoracaceae bacterium]